MSWRYFTLEEFDCQETGENEMQEWFIDELDELRGEVGFPFYIRQGSGYRSPSHSIERAKAEPGLHSDGIAVDIPVTGGAQRFLLVEAAIARGFTGIGVYNNHIHLDMRDSEPMMWGGKSAS